jgi:septal ring factor EnvC (AmiA/AmiB activator)
MGEIAGQLILAVVTAVIAYIAGYRKNKIENESSELDSVQKAIDIWQKTATDLQAETKELRTDVMKMRNENRRLHLAVAKFTKALQKFDAEIAEEINKEINNEKN